MDIQARENGLNKDMTSLTGVIRDQAELNGVINSLYDLMSQLFQSMRLHNVYNVNIYIS